ncbi:MAG: hypothetical protein RDV41_06975, partial [Planctomycetota bacterium]|nr:hypothetical protein [Planctomycetota bacterium]
MPETVLDAACAEIEDKREWGMFTRRYGTKEPLSSILVVISKNPDTMEEIDKDKYERWIKEHSEELKGTETKRYDDYPVFIGRNTSTYIVGGFWFSWFACQIQCTGKYAEMKYFDFVVRTILANLGLASAPAPYKPEEPDPGDTGPNNPELSVEKVDPEKVELAESGNVVFRVTVSNSTSLGKTAKAIVIRLVDGNGREIGRGSIDRLPNHEKTVVEVNAFIEIGGELNSRDIAVEVSCPAAARTLGNKISVKATRPASLTMQIEPRELVLNAEMEPPEFKLVLKNLGDQDSPDLLLQCFIDGTDFASEPETISNLDGSEEKERGSDLERVTGNVMEKYVKEKFSFLEAATLRIVLTDAAAGTVLCEDAIRYRIDDSLRSRLKLHLGPKEVAFDFTGGEGGDVELPPEEPSDIESGNSDLERQVWLGTPFNIFIVMTGVTNVKDVCVEMLDPAGKPVASWNMPVLHASFIKNGYNPPESEVKDLPTDDSFVAAVGCREGKTEFTVRLKCGTETLQQEKVRLTVKGNPEPGPREPGEVEPPAEPEPREPGPREPGEGEAPAEPGEKEEPNLMGRLIKAQRQQREFM